MQQIGQFVPLILIFGIMYFLLIRPQQKKVKEHQAMVQALRRGDQVVTQGGIIGKVVKVKEENEVEVEVADGVKIRVVQSTIAQACQVNVANRFLETAVYLGPCGPGSAVGTAKRVLYAGRAVERRGCRHRGRCRHP